MRVSGRFWIACCLLYFATVPTLVGCGTSERSVSGTISLEGNPLPMGSIRFVPMPGTPGPDSGTTITEGKYLASGLTDGEYRVEIQATKKHPTRTVRFPFPDVEIADEVQVVPVEYNEDSTLTYTVASGQNTYDLDIVGMQSAKAGARN